MGKNGQEVVRGLGFMGNDLELLPKGIRRTSSGRFEARYTVSGRRYSCGSFDSMLEAHAELLQAKKAIKAGVWVSPEEQEAHRLQELQRQRRDIVTVADYADEWWQAGQWKANTRRSYYSIITSKINPYFGYMPLAKVTTDDIRRWLNSGEWKNPKTANNAFAVLRSIFNSAVDDGLIDVSPCVAKGIIRKIDSVIEKPVITPKQVKLFHDLAPDNMKIVITLAVFGAMRIGEIIGLQRRDCDLDNGLIHIRRSVGKDESGRLVVGSPKSKAGNRVIAIPDPMMDELRYHLENYTYKGREAFVIRGANYYKPVRDKVIYKWFTPIAREPQHGIPKGFTFHCLRHTGLTLMGASGATLADLQYFAGHTAPDTVMIYQHSNAKRAKENVNKVFAHYNESAN